MKTRTNQPVFLDNGNPVDDSALGGTQLYKHVIVAGSSQEIIIFSPIATSVNNTDDVATLFKSMFSGYLYDNDNEYEGIITYVAGDSEETDGCVYFIDKYGEPYSHTLGGEIISDTVTPL